MRDIPLWASGKRESSASVKRSLTCSNASECNLAEERESKDSVKRTCTSVNMLQRKESVDAGSPGISTNLVHTQNDVNIKCSDPGGSTISEKEQESASTISSDLLSEATRDSSFGHVAGKNVNENDNVNALAVDNVPCNSQS